jgi:predicted transposase/invertase (TIGR01784 family)
VVARIQLDDFEELNDICKDNVFKAVFARETAESQKALSRLVSALIGWEVSIIEIKANEPPVDSIQERQIRYDINCVAENGELLNVEMSLNPDEVEPVRIEYNVGKLFTSQEIRGVGKGYKNLLRAYQITILGKRRFFADEDFFHVFEYYDPVRNVPLGGRSRIITVELSKLERVVEKPAVEMSGKELWAVFFKYLNDKKRRSKINEIIEREEGIAMTSELLKRISKDHAERLIRMSEEKHELDIQSRMTNAVDKGREQGRQEGKLEDAKKMLGKGLTIDLIHEITGLDTKTIQSL